MMYPGTIVEDVPALEPDAPELVIRPTSGWIPLRLRELAASRDLLYFFMWRDIKVRYKQTVLGAAWAFIQPFFAMLVFSLFFGYLGGMSARIEGGIPYPLFAFAGLCIWTYFAGALTQASDSLVSNANLLKKVYFPRLALPISAVAAGAVDFLVALVALFALMAYYGASPAWTVVFVPVFVLLAAITALGAGLWLSALNVQFRDVRYTLPFVMQLWLFASPIAYPSSVVPEQWRVVYGLNPMVGVVDGMRWAVLGAAAPAAVTLASTAAAVVLLVSGAYYFRRMEKTFSDLA